MRQPEIRRKKTNYDRDQKKDNRVLAEQKRHREAEAGRHRQPRAEENVRMVGLTIASQQQTAHNLRVRFGREEPAEGGERFRDGAGAHRRTPHCRHMSSALDRARDFFEQSALFRRSSHQQNKTYSQRREKTQSANDGKGHGLDLHVDNLADGENPQNHHYQAAINHLVPEWSGEQRLLVIVVHHTDQPEHQEGSGTKDPAGDAALGGVNLELSPQAGALAYYRRGLVQNLGKIAARLFLQKNRSGEEAHVVNRHAFDQIHHRLPDRKAQRLLLTESSKFLSHRVGNLIAHHLQHGSDGMPDPQTSRHEIDGLRQQGLEAVPPNPPQDVESDIRGGTHGRSDCATNHGFLFQKKSPPAVSNGAGVRKHKNGS